MSSKPDRDGPPPQSQPPPQGYPLDGYLYPPQGNPPPGYPYPPPANGFPQAPPGIVTLILEYYNSHIFYLRIFLFLLQSHYGIRYVVQIVRYQTNFMMVLHTVFQFCYCAEYRVWPAAATARILWTTTKLLSRRDHGSSTARILRTGSATTVWRLAPRMVS